MTQNELWEAYTKAHPEWLANGAHFAPAGLKKFFDAVWAHAYLHGKADGTRNTKDDFDNIFAGLFTKERKTP